MLTQPTDDPTFWYGTHIQFVMTGRTPTGKTIVWLIQNRKSAERLGTVQWFARWRKYCFFPNTTMVFEQDCLRDIAEFIEARTREHSGAKITMAEYVGG